jgi:hypothetical protein
VETATAPGRMVFGSTAPTVLNLVATEGGHRPGQLVSQINRFPFAANRL